MRGERQWGEEERMRSGGADEERATYLESRKRE